MGIQEAAVLQSYTVVRMWYVPVLFQFCHSATGVLSLSHHSTSAAQQ